MVLARALARGIAALNPLDDRYYSMPGGGMSAAGVYITAESALAHSAVWACVRLLAESTASLPLLVYRRRLDGGKDRALDHPIYDLLHSGPNPQTTAFSFKRVEMVHALLWGNAYAQILPGPRGPVDRLRVLHPDGVRPILQPDGTLAYRVNFKDGPRMLLDDEVFHLPGLSLDGYQGLSVMQYAREAIGLGLQARQYQSRFFSQGGRLGGILKVKGRLSKDGKLKLKEDWTAGNSGAAGAYRVAVLDEDAEFQTIGLTAEDAQVLSSLEWSSQDSARFFNVPLHMIGDTSNVTSWGSGIEQLSLGFVTYSLMPWLVNWQDTIGKDLIIANRTYFAEFLVDALLRGDTLKRYQAYQLAAGGQAPWMTRNEVRAAENRNPLEGLDEVLQPLNMGSTTGPNNSASQQSLGEQARANPYLEVFVRDAAARVVRKEIAALSRAAKRAAGDAEAWRDAAVHFYAEHTTFVAETLRLEPEQARQYCVRQLGELLERGPRAMDDWEPDRIDDLVAHALATSEERTPL
jgi:HK97 family phage portal protein